MIFYNILLLIFFCTVKADVEAPAAPAPAPPHLKPSPDRPTLTEQEQLALQQQQPVPSGAPTDVPLPAVQGRGEEGDGLPGLSGGSLCDWAEDDLNFAMHTGTPQLADAMAAARSERV